MKKLIAMILALVMILSLVACGASQAPATEAPKAEAPAAEAPKAETPAPAERKAYKVGFSNSYNGNTFRQTLEADFKAVADELVAQGVVSEYTMAVSNNDNTQQISQVQSFILDGCDIIIIDPGSATALNDVIDEVVAAGIIVFVISDGPVTTDTCYQLNTDGYACMNEVADAVCEIAGPDKKALLVRGITGLEIEQLFYEGHYDAAIEHGYEVVGEVEGQWTDSVAKEALAAVLPSLNYDVDVIMGQGGDDLVAAELFEEAGHRWLQPWWLPEMVGTRIRGVRLRNCLHRYRSCSGFHRSENRHRHSGRQGHPERERNVLRRHSADPGNAGR